MKMVNWTAPIPNIFARLDTSFDIFISSFDCIDDVHSRSEVASNCR